MSSMIFLTPSCTQTEVYVAVERYCSRTNEWRTVEPMHESRFGCAVIAHQGRIYVRWQPLTSRPLSLIQQNILWISMVQKPGLKISSLAFGGSSLTCPRCWCALAAVAGSARTRRSCAVWSVTTRRRTSGPSSRTWRRCVALWAEFWWTDRSTLTRSRTPSPPTDSSNLILHKGTQVDLTNYFYNFTFPWATKFSCFG